MNRMIILAALAAIAIALPAHAYDLQFSGSGGYLRHQAAGAEASWSGVDVGPSVTLSLHPLLSVFTQYVHGFPFKGEIDRHLDFANAQANLKVYGSERVSLAIGSGVMWWGVGDLKDWTGYTAALTAAVPFGGTGEWALFGKFSHGFAFDEAKPDFDTFRAGLNWGPRFVNR